MGRLVDENDVYNVLTEYYHHKTATQHMVLTDALSTVKTVDAIPVAWLEQEMEKWRNKDTFAHNLGVQLVEALLEDWEEDKKEWEG